MHRLNAVIQDRSSHRYATAGLVLLAAAAFVALLLGGRTSLLGPVYLVASCALGAWLYTAASPMYLGFVVWLWFLTPFIRRATDYALGSYTPPSQSLVLLTPFAVTTLALLDVWRFRRRLFARRYLPFLFCILAVFYGYIVGIVKVGAFPATRQLLMWLPPLLTGFYVLNRWQQTGAHIQVMKSTLTWGVLVLGVYGIAQFQLVPPWDAFWMRNAEMNSIGAPYPHQVRVFSMLDSPGPFAVTILTGLVLLMVRRRALAILAAVPGFVSFLLAGVRGAWIGWGVAIGAIIPRITGRLRTKLVGVLVAVCVVAVPVVMSGPMAERTTNRMETLKNVRQDGSYQARKRLYLAAPTRILTNPVGWGLGSRGMDSGILMLFWQLGWPGALLYLTGLALLLRNVFRATSFFAKLVMGIAAAYVFHFFLGGELLGEVTGVLFWSLASLAVAHRHTPDEAPEATAPSG